MMELRLHLCVTNDALASTTDDAHLLGCAGRLAKAADENLGRDIRIPHPPRRIWVEEI